MHTGYHARIGAAADLPINSTKPVISFSPVVLPRSGHSADLELRVTVPATGDELPIILLSHGQGQSNYLSSLEGYAPLYEFYAAHGFAVLQPTHMSSAFLGISYPLGQELFYQERALDMERIMDNLNTIEATVPGLKGRLDHSRIAVVGHSAGAFTAMMLLGLRNTDPRDGTVWHKPESRVRAGVCLGPLGHHGALDPETAARLIPFYNSEFDTMLKPALIVCGDEDEVGQKFSSQGSAWHADAYKLSKGPKDLVTIHGGGHGFGGVGGWDTAETKDESPERLGIVQRLTWAYLKSQLYEGDDSWSEACKALEGLKEKAEVESKN